MEKENLLQQIFETNMPSKFKDDEKIIVIDSFIQFSQNPTSMSAGYGIEENYPLIGENLKKRYKIEKIFIENVLAFLKESFEEMRKVSNNVYFWRDAIASYIKEKHMNVFLQWYDTLYEEKLSEDEKKAFLFFLYALRYTTSSRELARWFACFFDKEERLSERDIEDFLVEFGLGNVLYYRSSKGYVENLFIPFRFLDLLRERYEEKLPINEKQIIDFFENLSVSDIKLLEKCLKEVIPVYENKIGRIMLTAPFIAESSKSYFGVSPFVVEKIRELIRAKKQDFTKEWVQRLLDVLHSFAEENYPFADLKNAFEIEGAYCWEIRYSEAPEKAPINVSILLSPYIFPNILDKIRASSSLLNLIFLLKETLPAVIDALNYVAPQKYLIFIFEERSRNFYVVERGALSGDMSFVIDSFLSKFLPFLEKEVQIEKALPEYLKDRLENLKYFSKFPRLVSIRNRILEIEPKLRESIRIKLRENLGEQWKDKIIKKNLSLVEKCENVIRKRLDREKARDFLDGATLGELTNIAEIFPDIFDLNKDLVKGLLNLLNQYRKILEHPFQEPKEDVDEKTFERLKATLDYIERIIC